MISIMSQNISVVGLGYLGLTHAVTLAKLGHKVIGFDTNLEKIAGLSNGEIPFYEPGLRELFDEVVREGNLGFTAKIGDLSQRIAVHFICVGTPSASNGKSVDLSQLEAAVGQLATVSIEGSLIVGRSTAPVGTAKYLRDFVERSTGKRINMAWNPEFLSEGTAVRDSLNPSRIVIGTSDPLSENKLREVYAPITNLGVPLVSLDIETSELVKGAANSFLAIKVSFINGVASLAESTGASTSKIAQALGMDSRISPGFLANGLGFGGGCLPKDLLAFSEQARTSGQLHFADFLQSAYSINSGRVERAAAMVSAILKAPSGQNIAILGASFKPGTDDIRESQSIKLLERLNGLGYKTVIHDPVALANVTQELPYQKVATSIEEAVSGSDLLILATEWPAYSALNPLELKKYARNLNVLDTRGVLSRDTWRASGWFFAALGEPFPE
jgi:UDPglucose 6-dehydrogenase